MSKIGEKVKSMIRGWLQIQPAIERGSIYIQEPESFLSNVIRNKIWYRGDASELTQLYSELGDPHGCSAFWAKAPSDGSVRKLHSGLPALIVDTLAYLVKADLDSVKFEDDSADSTWQEITGPEGINFTELTGDAIVESLVCGDGAFKISIDTEISAYPLVEFYPGDQVDYEMRHGRIDAVNFYTTYSRIGHPYRLRERYAKGNVTYALFDGDNEVSLDKIPELAELKPVEFDGDYIMAVSYTHLLNDRYAKRICENLSLHY